MKKYTIIGGISGFLFPLIVSAQLLNINLGGGGGGTNPFLNILGKTKTLLDAVIPIVITLALIYFIYGVGKYMTAKDEEKQAEARNIMIYGTIGLFFIVSVWGIVLLLQQFTGVQPLQTPPTVPFVPGGGTGQGLFQINIPSIQLGF